MGLDVLEGKADGAAKRGEGADLVEGVGANLVRGGEDLAPAEADEVGEAGVGATVLSITRGSPPWKPQATLALEISGKSSPS